MHSLQGHRVTEWVADAIGLPQYVPVFKDNLITVSQAFSAPYLHCPPLTSHALWDAAHALENSSIAPPHIILLLMQVLDFPLLVNDGGASLKSDLGVRSVLHLHVSVTYGHDNSQKQIKLLSRIHAYSKPERPCLLCRSRASFTGSSWCGP